MRKRNKLVAVLLAVSVSMTLFAGCGSSSSSSSDDEEETTETEESEETEETEATEDESTDSGSDAFADLPDAIGDGTVTATPEMYSNIDLTDPYTVNIYLIGDTPNDWDAVLELWNEYMEPFNTTVDVTFMSWSDYTTMYSLVLAGGEQIDMIFTAPWCYMYTEASKGSFYTLSEDFIVDYMPLTAKYQAEESWGETTISGEIVAVPANTMDPNGKIVAIRQDIADEYGYESLSSWDDYMDFMLTVAEEETPVSGIYAIAAASDNNELWDVYRQQNNTFLALDSNYLDFIYEYEEGSLPTTDDISLVYDTDLFREYAYDMKTLADAGAWSRSALSNTITDDDAFGALQGASIAWNTSVFTYIEQAEESEGVVCAAYDLTEDNLVQAEAYSNNDMAIAAGSENPERTAMVLDIMKMDTYVNHLLILGIEGDHYSIDDDGVYTELDGAEDYAASAISASWAIKNGDLTEANMDEREQAIRDSWEPRIVANPTVSFVFDDSEVSSYKDAVSSILNDYVPMIELGLVDDVDATLDEMMEKLENAGYQTLKDEFDDQYNEWLESNG